MKFELKKYENNPILKPNPSSEWESLTVCNPAAWYEDGTFYLLYRGAGNDMYHHIMIGLATSKDGFNFTRYENNPVIKPTEDNYDEGCCEDPRVIKIGKLFYVTYAYRAFAPGRYWEEDHYIKPKYQLDEYVPNGLSYNTSNTALAISNDLKTFKKLGRITNYNLDNRDVILFPEKINGKYVRFERPVEYVGEKYGTDVPSMWINYSDNLMEWGEPILFAKPINDWEMKKMGGSTPPLKTKDGWLVLYHGVSLKDDMYRVGAMLLDINNPEIILSRTKDYIMEPFYHYETDGFYTGCVFPTGNVVVDGQLYVYYGGADRFVNVATCKLDDLLRYLTKTEV